MLRLQDDAVARRDLIPLNAFERAAESLYKKGRLLSPWSFISWATRQLGFTGIQSGGGKLREGRYVIVPNLEVRRDSTVLFAPACYSMELAPGMEPLEMILSWPALHVMDAIHVVVCVLKKKSLGQGSILIHLGTLCVREDMEHITLAQTLNY